MTQTKPTYMNPNNSKEFAIEVLNVFDELAKPEIKNRVMLKIWDYVKGHTFKIILKKPDSEIDEKLLIIHQKLNQRFKDIDSSIEINVMEKLNPGVSIPEVGELARVKNLTTVNKEQAAQLFKELF